MSKKVYNPGEEIDECLVDEAYSLSPTTVSIDVMEEVYEDLDDAPEGTEKLGKLLQEIENEWRY